MTRKEKKIFANDVTAAHFTIETRLEIWGTNKELEEKQVTLDITCYNLNDSNWEHHLSKAVILKPNASTELWDGELPGQPKRTKLSEVPAPIIVSARLLDENGQVLARYCNWYVP